MKPTGLADYATAETIISELSAELGQPPAVIVHSGHGLQPWWTLDRDDADGLTAGDLARWHMLLVRRAAAHNGRVDNVYDRARMLRVPGTTNTKDATPLPVTAVRGHGGPVTVERFREVLDENAIPEHVEQPVGDVVEPPEDWAFAEDATCPYVTSMIRGWRTDTPDARHPWLVAQFVRLACAHRLGCITEADHAAAVATLSERFRWLLDNHGQPRAEARGELVGAQVWAVDLASRKTTADALVSELGGHRHDDAESDAHGAKQNPGTDLPRVWRATDLEPARQTEWLARKRLPRSAVTILVGDEGIGKSLLWVWIVAAVTTGRAVPEFGIPARKAARVMLIFTEDEWASTIRPRLDVGGDVLEMVDVICTEADGSGSPTFPRDMHLLDGTTAELIVVDAFLDTVPGGLHVKDPQQARQALHPWKECATATGASVMLLTHTNRVDSQNARDKYGITGELRKKARMTLYAQQHDGYLVVGPEKSNLVGDVLASKFRIDAVPWFEQTLDADGTVPRLVYVGESNLSAQGHLKQAYAEQHDNDDADERTEAETWLGDYLKKNGTKLSKDAKAAAREVGITERTLRRAAKRLNVVYTASGYPRVTYWSLPSKDGQATDEDGQAADEPCPPESGPTDPTDRDQGKRSDPTGQSGQSGQSPSDSPTGDRKRLCAKCGKYRHLNLNTRLCADCAVATP